MDTLNYSFVRRPFEPVNIRRRDFLLLPRECRQVSGELKVLATRGFGNDMGIHHQIRCASCAHIWKGRLKKDEEQ